MIIIKIILYLLLTIFFLLLGAVLFVLLSRIRFDIQANKNGSPKLKIRLSWLLSSLRFGYELDSGGQKLRFTLLWFDLTKSKNDKTDENSKAETENRKLKSSEEHIKRTEKANVPVKEKPDKPEDAPNKKSVLDKIESAHEGYRKFADYPDKDLILEYTLRLIADLLRAIGFKRFRLNAVLGLDDPALTGMACALAYSLCGASGLDISLEMNCEQPTFTLDCRISGKTSLWAFTWPLIKFALRKPILSIIKKRLFRKGEKHEHKQQYRGSL